MSTDTNAESTRIHRPMFADVVTAREEADFWCRATVCMIFTGADPDRLAETRRYRDAAEDALAAALADFQQAIDQAAAK
jgi:hypothetical protein